MSGFNSQKHGIIFPIVVVQSVIAITMQFFIVYAYLRFSDLRKRSFEHIFVLSVSSILANMSYMLQPADRANPTGSFECTFQGFFMNFFDMAVVGWTSVIAVSLHRAVVLQRPSLPRPVLHGAVWGGALVLSVVPLATESYGNSGPWCWIEGDNAVGQALRFTCFYIPLWIAFVVNVIIYSEVSSTLKRFAVMSTTAKQGDKLSKMALDLRRYPLIFVVSWAANTVIRVVQACYAGANSSFKFALVHVIFHGSFYQAVGNTFAYGLNESVKAKFSELSSEVRRTGSLRPVFGLEAHSGDNEDDLTNSISMTAANSRSESCTVEEPPGTLAERTERLTGQKS